MVMNFAEHLRAAKDRGCPSDEPGAKQEVPDIQGNKHKNAAPEVTGRLESDVAVHEEVERAGAGNGDAVCDTR